MHVIWLTLNWKGEKKSSSGQDSYFALELTCWPENSESPPIEFWMWHTDTINSYFVLKFK